MYDFAHAHGEIRSAREAAALTEWLCESGENLVALAGAFGGSDRASRADGVVTSDRQGEEVGGHYRDLRALRDFLCDCVDGNLPAVRRKDDVIVRCDPEDPRAIAAQDCGNVLHCGVEALEALEKPRVRLIRDCGQ